MTYTYTAPFLPNVRRLLVGHPRDLVRTSYYLPFCHCKLYIAGAGRKHTSCLHRLL